MNARVVTGVYILLVVIIEQNISKNSIIKSVFAAGFLRDGTKNSLWNLVHN